MNEHFVITMVAVISLGIFTFFSFKRVNKMEVSITIQRGGIILFLTGLLLGYDLFSRSK